MRQFAVAVLLAVGLILAGCGTSSHPGNINGTWTATLSNPQNTTVFSFGTSLAVNGDGSLNVSNFNFTTSSPCFVSGETESGSFGFTGDFNGNVTGTFGFTVKSGTPAGNTLTLAGTTSGNTIKGTWTLTGPGCNGSGSFVMNKM